MSQYRELSIRIDPNGDSGFAVTASISGGRASGQQPFVPPPTDGTSPAALLAVRSAPTAMARRDVDEPSQRLAPVLDAKDYGRDLFSAVFDDEIERLYSTLRSDTTSCLRIRLCVGSSDASLTRIAAIPWELLVDPDESDLVLALSERHSIVRTLAVTSAIDAVEIPRPLRILCVSANPQATTPLNLDEERQRVTARWLGALDTELVNVPPTRDALRAALDSRQFHVLHFMGHGHFSEATGDGALVLEDEAGLPDMLHAEELRVMVADRGLRLVFLNACETGTAASTPVDDAFGGLPAALIAAGVPAVVANQVPVADASAIEFADTFYTRLVSGGTVDAAVTAGRQRLFRVNDHEWATPVLYMRSESGVLFTMQPHVAPAARSGTAAGRVFLASTSASLRAMRTGLADGLRALGIEVAMLDDGTVSPGGATADARVRAEVSAADLTVHLLDADAGPPSASDRPLLPGVPDTVPLRELILASQSARSQLVLYEGPLDAATIADTGYAAYFEALVRRTRDERRFEVASASRSRMKDVIAGRLALLTGATGPANRATNGVPPALLTGINRVYIDVHSSDVDLTTPLMRALRDRELSVALGGAVSTGTPASRLAAAEDAVARADLVILVYGDVANEWAEQRFHWLDQLLSRHELQTRIAIFTPTPKAPADLRFNSRTRYPVFDGAGLTDGVLDSVLVAP